MVELVLVQCYLTKVEASYTFRRNKSYAYLLNVEPCNSVFFKTYTTEFDDVITFTYQNGRLLEIEDKALFDITY